MKRKFVSFDVFDTCLVRRCGIPCKIWDLMANRLFEKDDDCGRLSFTGNRSVAEEKLSKKNPFPTLKDIYEALNVSQWGFNQDAVMNLEMEIEERELFPNPQMLEIVNDFRQKGFTIAFVSDMYLPTEFIKKVLIKFGFCRENENVFISADCKATKYSGKLFDLVFEKTGTKAKQWIHYGDNERSDYRVPISKGVKSNLVSDADFTDEEKRWLDKACCYPHKHEIELWVGLCRLTRVQNEKSFAATMAIDFIASVYIPYVVYVLRTAKEKGIETLYFLARDSHIFMEIAKFLKESEKIECRYLQLNRRVLYPCVFYNVDDYELKLVIKSVYYHTVKNALEYIGIDYALLSDLTKKEFSNNFIFKSEKQKRNFAECLMKNDSELLRETSREKRQLLLKYLEQENFFNQKSAMVDLGWLGSCRCIANYILKNEGHAPVSSFYFGYNRELIYGNADDSLFVYNKQYDMTKFPCGYLFFEDYASLNPQGTTTGYKQDCERIVPIEENANKFAESLAAINEFYVSAFCKNFYFVHSMTLDALNDIFCLCGLNQMSRIISAPSRKQIDFFRKIEFENYTITQKMVRKLPLKEIGALLVWGKNTTVSLIWAEAAIKVTFGPFASLFVRFYKFSSQTALANRLRLWWENRA